MFKHRPLSILVASLLVLALAAGCAAATSANPSATGQAPNPQGNDIQFAGLGGGTTGSLTGVNTAQVPSDVRSITVIGSGTASGTPDIATAQIGVDTQGASPEVVTKQNNDQLSAVVAALKAAGIAENDIQTSYYSVYSEQRFKPETGQSTGEFIYHASSAVNVTIRDLSKVGIVLDKAVSAGANNISGVSFSVADPSKLLADAREKAVTDARARASDLAKLFGVQVGDALVISEVSMGGPTPVFDRAAAVGLGGGGASIQPGQLTISAQIQVSFAIK
jgi:uncharacterized protein YggE